MYMSYFYITLFDAISNGAPSIGLTPLHLPLFGVLNGIDYICQQSLSAHIVKYSACMGTHTISFNKSCFSKNRTRYKTSKLVKRLCDQVVLTLRTLETETSWANRAELYIGFIKEAL